MNTIEHKDLMAQLARLRSRLVEIAKDRHLRQNIVKTSHGPELEWVLHERAAMLAAVNEVRTERGYRLAELSEVELADRLASGHVDWLDKFALGCARIAVGGDTASAC